MIITAAMEDASLATGSSQCDTIFGVNADPRLATKLFRENFAEYRRLKNIADAHANRQSKR
jgi:hypothetical protein